MMTFYRHIRFFVQKEGEEKLLTASASGLTPFSIKETQYESVWRSRLVF
jgi:hypothetical protein